MQQAIATRTPEQELICALDHLVKADELLRDIPQTRKLGKASTDLGYATGYTRSSLEWLRREKEEPCKQS